MIVTEICTLAFAHCLNTVTGENKHILFCSLHVLQCFDFFSSFFFNNIGTMAVLVKDIFFCVWGFKNCSHGAFVACAVLGYSFCSSDHTVACIAVLHIFCWKHYITRF